MRDSLFRNGDSKGAAVAEAFIDGPLRVISATGKNITPGSALRQAILAVLLLARSQTRERRSLQEMFWGSAATERSSASLRTAIYLLRRDLSLIGADCVRADRHTVSLAPGCISIAPHSSITPSFLAGLDLPLVDCEGFEDWLRHMRSSRSDEMPFNVDTNASALRKRRLSHLALGLLESHKAGLSEGDEIRANSILDGIARSISHLTAVDIHDLRGCADFVTPLPVDSGLGAGRVAKLVEI